MRNGLLKLIGTEEPKRRALYRSIGRFFSLFAAVGLALIGLAVFAYLLQALR